jgi:hypothetical protein
MIEHSEDKELTKVFNAVLALEEHAALREQEVKIVPLLKVNNDNATGEPKKCKGLGVVCKKLGADVKACLSADYLLIMDYGRWNEIASWQREALVHHALQSIKVDLKGSKPKLVRNPPVPIQPRTAERYGAYTDEQISIRDAWRRPATTRALAAVSQALEGKVDTEEVGEQTPAEQIKAVQKWRQKKAAEAEAETEEQEPKPKLKVLPKPKKTAAEEEELGIRTADEELAEAEEETTPAPRRRLAKVAP